MHPAPRLHILGVCGTFMGGVARLARALGYRVSGSDQNTYPPMSTQLEELDVELFEGYSADNLPDDAELIVVGNAISRGNPELEAVMNRALPYTSGAEWLAERVLRGRWVLAVAGTHGKTTTASALAWLLEDNGLKPGFLIGGVPENFGVSARLGGGEVFVIEADEYDTAFFDKRSKFVHYRPRTLVLNNLEFDHADIFSDLDEIKRQFHHLLRTVPANGKVIVNRDAPELTDVLAAGCWSEVETFGLDTGDDMTPPGWYARAENAAADRFDLYRRSADGSREMGQADWSLFGEHNMRNALAAVAAARHAGVNIADACRSLAGFRSVKRRLEQIADVGGIQVYDDFAHHPTAIAETLVALRKRVGAQRILAVLEARSNTMRQGVHKHLLAAALAKADQAYFYASDQLDWDAGLLNENGVQVFEDTNAIVDALRRHAEPGDQILIMSNGGFENLHQRLISALTAGARRAAANHPPMNSPD